MTNNGYQFVEIDWLGNMGVEAGVENDSPIRCSDAGSHRHGRQRLILPAAA